MKKASSIKKLTFVWLGVLIILGVFSMPAMAESISGKVTDTAGNAIENATVSLVGTEYTAMTGADGTYTIENVPSGNYFVMVVPPIDSKYLPGQTRESVTPGGTANVNLSVKTPVGATYVGDSQCKVCHSSEFIGGTQYLTWKDTFHATSLRTPDPAFDGQPKKGVVGNFSLDPVLSDPKNNITNAVIDLNFNGTTYTAKIGEVTYTIVRTYGGNGYWKQRYLTKIGNSYYILPMQWNEKTGEWVAYHLENWFQKNSAGVPLYAPGETPVTKNRTADSFERRCAGCHNTGLTISINADGEYVTDYVGKDTTEDGLNIGCEKCHGPGSEHLDGGGKANDIIRPDLLTYTRSSEVCGQCHSRGTSAEQPGNKTFGYPWNSSMNGGFTPGMNLADFYKGYTMEDNVKGYFWTAAEDYPEDDLHEGDAIAANMHHEQWPELSGSAKHANNPFHLVTCFDCHNPHGSSLEHNLVEKSMGRNITDVNSLCLSCHQEHPPFNGSTDHFSGEYDTMAGVECSECHMVKTAKSAVRNTTTNEGDIHSHTFWNVKPKYSANGMPNSCTTCHTYWNLTIAQQEYDKLAASIKGEVPPTPVTGDINGDGKVDMNDANLVAQMVIGKYPEDVEKADFNENGRVDIGDAAKIAFYVAGKIPSL